MRCERCKFENIPGRKTCIKCNSILDAESEQIDIYPPRMSKWKRPIRHLIRSIRKETAPLKKIVLYCSALIARAFDSNVLGLFLSVIPGLAHVTQKRFKEIRWYFLAWLALLISGLFLYGGQAGFVCLGMAVGIHTAIAVQYKILRSLEGIAKKIAIIIIVLTALTVIYRVSPHVLVPNLTGGYSSLSVPHQEVATGDYLLGWRNLEENAALKRGDLVFIHPIYNYINARGQTITTDIEHLTVGQIIGLAGEQFEIKDGVFMVNGQQLDSNIYPVPQWLQINDFSVIIPDRSYFVIVQYDFRAYNMVLVAENVNQICVRQADDIQSRIFMRWWPLTRRGFIR